MENDYLEDTRWKGEKVPPEKLREILAAHEKWLLSDDSKLDPEDLSGANLRGADLRGARLRFATAGSVELKGEKGESTGKFWPTNFSESQPRRRRPVAGESKRGEPHRRQSERDDPRQIEVVLVRLSPASTRPRLRGDCAVAPRSRRGAVARLGLTCAARGCLSRRVRPRRRPRR